MQEEISVSLMIHIEAGGEEGVEMNVWGERECVDKKQIMLGSQGVICLFLVQGELCLKRHIQVRLRKVFLAG